MRLQGDGRLFEYFFNDHIVYMIVNFLFKSGGWAFIGIWAYIRINTVITLKLTDVNALHNKVHLKC